MMGFIKEILQFVIDFWIWIQKIKLDKYGKKVPSRIIAHRGWHNNKNLIENTLQSFQTALDHNLYGIEFDVRWTKDLIPIVHHDDDLNRLWDTDYDIADLTYEEVHKLAPMIPTLQKVIDEFGGKIHLLIELKEEPFLKIDYQKGLLEKILAPLTAQKDYHFLLLEPDMVKEFDNFDRKSFISVSELDPARTWMNTLEHGLKGMTGHYLLLEDKYLKEAREKSLLIGTGFLRTKSCLNREKNRGVEYHFTNHPWNLLNSDS